MLRSNPTLKTDSMVPEKGAMEHKCRFGVEDERRQAGLGVTALGNKHTKHELQASTSELFSGSITHRVCRRSEKAVDAGFVSGAFVKSLGRAPFPTAPNTQCRWVQLAQTFRTRPELQLLFCQPQTSGQGFQGEPGHSIHPIWAGELLTTF